MKSTLLKLHRHALLCTLLLLVAGALAYWAEQHKQEANAERTSAANDLLQIERRLHRVHSEEQEIRERTGRFQQLEQAGITGEEKRLEWVELLHDLQRQQRLPGMNYEFGRQRALEQGTDNTFSYHSSHLHIQLRLLHEADLLSFLQQLQLRAKAIVVLRSCRLSRLAANNPEANGLAQLSAECEMEWVSLRHASTGKTP